MLESTGLPQSKGAEARFRKQLLGRTVSLRISSARCSGSMPPSAVHSSTSGSMGVKSTEYVGSSLCSGLPNAGVGPVAPA